MLKALFSLCNATPQRCFNARRQRKRYYISFLARNGEEEKGQKEILWQRNRVVTWYIWAQGSKPKIGLGSGLRGKGSGLRRMGSGITRLLSPNQGSDLLHGLKLSYHNIFPHNKVCVHRISWPRYITHSCFRLTAVPVIRSLGCLTKTWYHILNLFIVEGTVIWISRP